MEQYIREHLRAHFKMKKTISIIQILILIIGILAFSYIFGEIEKKSGIEISGERKETPGIGGTVAHYRL